MTIGYFSPQSVFPSHQAHTIQIVRMCEAFADAGHEVVLSAGRCGAWEDVAAFYGVDKKFNVVTTKVPKIIGGRRLYGSLAAYRMKRQRVDLAYGRCLHSCAASTMLQLPTMFEAHTPLSYYGRRSRKLFQQMLDARTFLRLVVISKALAKQYEADGVPHSKITVAPDAAKPFAPRTPPANEKTVIGYAGSLFQGKGIEVVAALTKVCPWATFLIAGGPEKEAREWESKVNPDNTVFVGAVDPSKIGEILSACDVLIAPYQQPSFDCSSKDISAWMSPLKLFDYLEAGKPIVVSDLPVLREVVDNRVVTFCSPTDTPEWVRVLKEFAESPTRREQFTRAAREHVRGRHWSDRVTQVLANV